MCIPALQALKQGRVPRKARHGAVHVQVRAAAATEQVQDNLATFGATINLIAAVRGNDACSNSPGLTGSCAAQAIKAEDSVDQAPATLLREGVDSPDRYTSGVPRELEVMLAARGAHAQADSHMSSPFPLCSAAPT